MNGSQVGLLSHDPLCCHLTPGGVQCIGRVIRHRGDWAAVLLVDARCGSLFLAEV